MEKYQDAIGAIIRHLILRDIFIVIPCIVLLIIIIMGIRKEYFQKRILFLVIPFVLICLSYVSFQYISLGSDIHNQNYATYDGAFEYDVVLGKTGDQVELLNDKNITLYNLHNYLEEGTYEGTVVYVEKTKFVLHIDATLKQ